MRQKRPPNRDVRRNQGTRKSCRMNMSHIQAILVGVRLMNEHLSNAKHSFEAGPKHLRMSPPDYSVQRELSRDYRKVPLRATFGTAGFWRVQVSNQKMNERPPGPNEASRHVRKAGFHTTRNKHKCPWNDRCMVRLLLVSDAKDHGAQETMLLHHLAHWGKLEEAVSLYLSSSEHSAPSLLA